VFHWLGEHEGRLQPLPGMPLLPTVPLVLSWIWLNAFVPKTKLSFGVLGPNNIIAFVEITDGNSCTFEQVFSAQAGDNFLTSLLPIYSKRKDVNSSAADVATIAMAVTCPSETFVQKVFDPMAKFEILRGAPRIEAILNDDFVVLFNRDFGEARLPDFGCFALDCFLDSPFGGNLDAPFLPSLPDRSPMHY